MSHSQFHSIKVFTLRHAWLNLWDKHMTTGRINQITIVQTWKRKHPNDKLMPQTDVTPQRTKQSWHTAWITCRQSSQMMWFCARVHRVTPMTSTNRPKSEFINTILGPSLPRLVGFSSQQKVHQWLNCYISIKCKETKSPKAHRKGGFLTSPTSTLT